MAYTPPTIAPSGTTFAQLQAGGFSKQLDRLAGANNFTPAVRSLVLGRVNAIRTGIVHTIDAYLRGDPATIGDINARLLNYATALRAIAAAIDEVNTLVAANPGTIRPVIRPGVPQVQYRRTFP